MNNAFNKPDKLDEIRRKQKHKRAKIEEQRKLSLAKKNVCFDCDGKGGSEMVGHWCWCDTCVGTGMLL